MHVLLSGVGMSRSPAVQQADNLAGAAMRPNRQSVAWRNWLSRLYREDVPEAHRFRYGLLVFDLITILFIMGTSFLPRSQIVEGIDVALGLVLLADMTARFIISKSKLRHLIYPTTLADAVAVISFLAPITGEGGGFLRILRTLRLFHSYEMLDRLRNDSKFFARNEEVILAITNLCVFVFVMTGIVYETQHRTNPNIGNYADALYFTVTALTTTGFGDITLPGTTGRMISIVIMISGVTLFLRLAQSLFRPQKVRFPCPSCGLQRHEPDAVHCKACGMVLNIPDEGE
jgi:voltage-gated potassium channel